MFQLLLLLAVVTRADSPEASSASVKSLLNDLANCSSAAQDVIDCFASLQSRAQKLHSHLHELHMVRLHLKTLAEDFSMLDLILSAAAGKWKNENVTRTVKTIQHLIAALELLLGKTGEPPPYEAKLERLRKTIATSVGSLTAVRFLCLNGLKELTRTRDCIKAMPTSWPVRSWLVSELKTFSSINRPPTRAVLQAMSNLRSVCSELQKNVSLSCPDLSSLKKIFGWIDSFRCIFAGAFQAIGYVLNLSVCLPNLWWPFPRISQMLEDAFKYFMPFSRPAEIGCVSVRDVINIATEVRDWSVFGYIKGKLLPKVLSTFLSLILPDKSDLLAALRCDLTIEIPSLDTDFDTVDFFLAIDFQRAVDLGFSCEDNAAV